VDESRSWGLEIGIDKGTKGVTYWHSGINPGSQSLMVMDTDKNTGIVVLTNSDKGLNFAREVARLALNADAEWEVPR